MLNQIFLQQKLTENGFSKKEIENISDIIMEETNEKNKHIRLHEENNKLSLILELGGIEREVYPIEELTSTEFYNIIHKFIKENESSTKQFVSAILNGYLGDPNFYEAQERAETLFYIIYSSISQDYTRLFYDSSILLNFEDVKQVEPYQLFLILAFPYIDKTKLIYQSVINKYKDELHLDSTFELKHHTNAITDVIFKDLSKDLDFKNE